MNNIKTHKKLNNNNLHSIFVTNTPLPSQSLNRLRMMEEFTQLLFCLPCSSSLFLTKVQCKNVSLIQIDRRNVYQPLNSSLILKTIITFVSFKSVDNNIQMYEERLDYVFLNAHCRGLSNFPYNCIYIYLFHVCMTRFF